MIPKSQIFSLFSVPVYSTIVDISDDIKNKITNLQYRDIESKNGKMSISTKLLNEIEFEKLKDLIDFEVQQYARNIFQSTDSIEFFLTTSWAMKHDKGNWSDSHNHANSVISGIFYIQVDKNSGDLIFNKKTNNLTEGLLEIPSKIYNQFNSHKFTIKPENNQLIIFPSNLPHEVEKSQSNNARYCIAFNYFVKGIFGRNESELVLT